MAAYERLNQSRVRSSTPKHLAEVQFCFLGYRKYRGRNELTAKFNLSFVAPLELILSSGYGAYIFVLLCSIKTLPSSVRELW